MFGARMRDSTMGLYGAGMPFGAPLPPAAPLAPAAPAGSAASDPEVQIIEPDSEGASRFFILSGNHNICIAILPWIQSTD